MIDLDFNKVVLPDTQLWTPPKPAIVRRAEDVPVYPHQGMMPMMFGGGGINGGALPDPPTLTGSVGAETDGNSSIHNTTHTVPSGTDCLVLMCCNINLSSVRTWSSATWDGTSMTNVANGSWNETQTTSSMNVAVAMFVLNNPTPKIATVQGNITAASVGHIAAYNVVGWQYGVNTLATSINYTSESVRQTASYNFTGLSSNGALVIAGRVAGAMTQSDWSAPGGDFTVGWDYNQSGYGTTYLGGFVGQSRTGLSSFNCSTTVTHGRNDGGGYLYACLTD